MIVPVVPATDFAFAFTAGLNVVYLHSPGMKCDGIPDVAQRAIQTVSLCADHLDPETRMAVVARFRAGMTLIADEAFPEFTGDSIIMSRQMFEALACVPLDASGRFRRADVCAELGRS